MANLSRSAPQKTIPVVEAKAKVLDLIQQGFKVAAACAVVGRKEETYRDWRKTDKEFAAAVDSIRAHISDNVKNGKREVPDFETFCREWLKQPLHPHQLRILDVIEGREPRDLHESMSYLPGYADRVLINIPPEHCPAVDTLVPTTRGMVAAGDLVAGDFVYSPTGKPVEVLESRRIDEPTEAQYRVTFSTGDSFVVDASHSWMVRDLTQGARAYANPALEARTDMMAATVLTKSGQRRWRVDVAEAVTGTEAELPLDPYLLGYWLGDGDTHGSRFAVGEQDLSNLEDALTRAGFTFRTAPMKGGFEVYAHKMRKLLPLGDKRIPSAYMHASIPQRMELLRGLLDSDGTITAKDGRARFVQDEKRAGLARQIYTLIASLGYLPNMKQYGRMVEVAFRPGLEPVFRLARKAERQKALPSAKSKTQTRTIASIELLDTRVPIQALIVVGGQLLIGEGYIWTHNGKSTTFTVNYCVWSIAKDPDIRIVIVSKGARLAENFLYEIKEKLTSPMFREMQIAFGPADGWQDPNNAWTNDRIYIKGKNEDATAGIQKDPTVQAMGLKGSIYGQRADLIILDDLIDADNAREVETQLRKINRDISSRLPDGGLLLCLGTRVAPMDLYRVLTEITDADYGRVWTYFRMPAVLDYGNGDSPTWTTLWPWARPTKVDRLKKKRIEMRCLHCYAPAETCSCDKPWHEEAAQKWAGEQLGRKRHDTGWNLYYQQLDVDDDMTFKAEAVNASVNGLRFPGPMTPEGKGHRVNGMEGLYRVIGLDPAASGNTAIVVAGLDPETTKRWVIDGWNKPNANSGQIIEKFKELTDKYRPHEWVVEKNAFQRFLTQLPEIVDYARTRGVKITPHHTTINKFDQDWGVQTMGPLFDSCVEWDAERKRWAKTDRGLIELPSTRQNPWVNQLVQQLTIWQPQGMAQKQKTDLVMALWFTHIAFMAQINRKTNRQSHYNTPFTTPGAKRRQQVIDLAALRRAKQEQAMEGIA